MPVDGEALRIFFLDVGQGDCTFVVPPSDESDPILFDCRDDYVAERFVADHRIENLRAVVASHFDLDHVRGMLPFLKTHFEEGRRLDKLVMFPDRVPRPGRNANLRALMKQAIEWERSPPHDGFVLKASHRDGDGPLALASGTGWSVELVLPWVGAVSQNLLEGGQDPNANSAVLRVSRGGTSFLIGGDAPLGSWERLEEPQLRAAGIRVPHHGGDILEGGRDWATFGDLYKAVGAELAVVSVGTNNGYSHPDLDHIAAARRVSMCRLLCTQLTPRCHPDPLELRDEAINYAAGVEWPYRHRAVHGHPRSRPVREVPCAGSVVVWIQADGSWNVEPAQGDDHDRLLAQVECAACLTPEE